MSFPKVPKKAKIRLILCFLDFAIFASSCVNFAHEIRIFSRQILKILHVFSNHGNLSFHLKPARPRSMAWLAWYLRICTDHLDAEIAWCRFDMGINSKRTRILKFWQKLKKSRTKCLVAVSCDMGIDSKRLGADLTWQFTQNWHEFEKLKKFWPKL